MHGNRAVSSAPEWRKHWYLPLVAALGFSAAGLQSYGMGPFIAPLQQEFGWTRAQILSGLTICNIGYALCVVPMGMLIDRWGSHRVACVGVILMPGAFALLSTANGTMANWVLLWLLISVGYLWVGAPVWTKAVASRFDVGRGKAIAITLSGGALGSMVLPPLSTWMIGWLGWQKAFIGVGIAWMALLFPPVFLFFRAAPRGTSEAEPQISPRWTSVHVMEGLKSPALYLLMLSGAFFALSVFGVIVNLVPILTSSGATPMAAAGMASAAGACAIAGRLITGWALDKMPGHMVGGVIFLLPVLSCALLLVDGSSSTNQMLAACIFGLSMGAELDVMYYLSSRYFAHHILGFMLSAITTATSIGIAAGPLLAGLLFDHFHDYSVFLVITIILTSMGSLAVASLRFIPNLSH